MLALASCLASALCASQPLPLAERPDPLVIVPAADFPPGLSRSERARKVVLAIESGSDGRVTDCRVDQTSGERLIDAESCRIMRTRAVLYRSALPNGRVRFWWYSRLSNESVAARGAPLLLMVGPLFRGADYPMVARQRNQSGTVGYRVEVSPTGRPLSCDIDSSSGSRALDDQSCALVMARAVFIPKTDGEGVRSAGTFHGVVTWRF